MRHTLRLEGHAFALRPVQLADVELIIQLRTSLDARARYLHPIKPTIAAQEAWLARYFQQEGDYYFVVERLDTRQPEGLISLYNIDTSGKSGELGRWILRSHSLGAVESVLLVYRMAFEQINLGEVYTRTIADNRSVVGFHDSCGLRRRGEIPGHFELNGMTYDATEHVLTFREWPSVRERLSSRAKQIGWRFFRAG